MKREGGFSLIECLLALAVLGAFLGGAAMLFLTISKENRLAEQLAKATSIANDMLEKSHLSPLPSQEFDVKAAGVTYHGKVDRKPWGTGIQIVVTVSWTERGTSHEVSLYTLSAQ
jgi:prepilin-type N-terminal cleavage/methylation domain-containing protein